MCEFVSFYFRGVVGLLMKLEYFVRFRGFEFVGKFFVYFSLRRSGRFFVGRVRFIVYFEVVVLSINSRLGTGIRASFG